MQTFFSILVIVSILCLIIGAIKPSWIKMPSRKRASIIFGVTTFILFILVGATGPKITPFMKPTTAPTATPASTQTPSPQTTNTTNPTPKLTAVEQAQQNLKNNIQGDIASLGGAIQATYQDLCSVNLQG